MNLEDVRQCLRALTAKSRRKWINWLFKIIWGLLLVLVVWGFWKYRGQILPYLKGANYRYLVLAMGLCIFAYFLSFVGWYTIFQPFKSAIPWWKHAIIYGFTLAMRRIPGTLWYVGGRLVFYRRLGISEWDTSVASSLELIITMATGIMVGLMLLPMGLRLQPVLIIILLVFALSGCLLVQPPVLSRLMTWLGRPLKWNVSFSRTWIWLVVYIVVWITSGLMLTQIIHTFRTITASDFAYAIGAWALSGSAGLLTLFLPSTFGVPELVLASLLSVLMPLPLAGFIAIFTRLTTLLAEVLLSAACYPGVLKVPDLKG